MFIIVNLLITANKFELFVFCLLLHCLLIRCVDSIECYRSCRTRHSPISRRFWNLVQSHAVLCWAVPDRWIAWRKSLWATRCYGKLSTRTPNCSTNSVLTWRMSILERSVNGVSIASGFQVFWNSSYANAFALNNTTYFRIHRSLSRSCCRAWETHRSLPGRAAQSQSIGGNASIEQ